MGVNVGGTIPTEPTSDADAEYTDTDAML